ncbi:helix-turn-helix domain-containing protein [Cohnella soli]|uniref:Helix-turn-helix domain-containing protein n=1 Tax=Cohnella soli TaxID=425005 RepID=A0ABW0HZK3_9BACL
MIRKEAAGRRFHFDNVFLKGECAFGAIDLYQIGELWCESGYEVPSHEQFCMEISYIVSGSGYFYVDDECIPVSAGDLFFNAVGSTHAIKSDSAGTLRYMYLGFMFNEKAAEDFAEIEAFLRSASYFHAKDAHHIMLPFNRNIDEFYSQKPLSGTMIRNYLEEIIVLSYRAFSEYAGKSERYSPRKSSHSVGYTVYSVIRYIENNLLELKSIRGIADDLGYSYTYLSHLFKDKTGMTLQRYINLKKAEKALEMIRFSALPIKEIAANLQYETIQSFSKAFSRMMGKPPSYYAALYRNESDTEE